MFRGISSTKAPMMLKKAVAMLDPINTKLMIKAETAIATPRP
jgi:hypothetical protein